MAANVPPGQRRPSLRATFVRGTLAVLLLGPISYTAAARADDLFDLSLEELLDIEITSVSKKPQALSDAAAAVYVITQEDIRRSGVTSIPEALRLAPGVQVARINAHQWAISTRGFNNQFANKLLVLIDGRTVYTPLFSGVFWDVQDTVLDDIDRIEVIRGPGASIWGANAVNGVINIITKSAADTLGTAVNVALGTGEPGFVSARHGGPLGDRGYFRVFGKYVDRDSQVTPAGDDSSHELDMLRLGFRVDTVVSASDELNVQGEIYQGDGSGQSTVFTPTPPALFLETADVDLSGAHLLMRWMRPLERGGSVSLRGYFDHTERRERRLEQRIDTFDLEFQHNAYVGRRHNIVWGAGFRHTDTELHDGPTFDFTPDERQDQLLSLFVQDEISLVPDRWSLSAGLRLEDNDFSGFEIQPNLRLLWHPSETQALWAALSRAVRTPSPAEHGITVTGIPGVIPPFTAQNPTPATVVLGFNGDPRTDSEAVVALDLGYRHQPLDAFKYEVALFYNDYQDIVGAGPGEPVCRPGEVPVASAPLCVIAADYVFSPLRLVNRLSAESYGVELNATWQLHERWRLHGWYAFINVDVHGGLSPTDEFRDEGSTPNHQISLRSLWDIDSDWSLDLWLRYVDELPFIDVDSYVTADARLSWRPNRHTEIALVGQNLLEERHAEFSDVLSGTPRTEIERAVYIQTRFRF